MTAATLPLSTSAPTWRDRLCARMGGLCHLLRAAHNARVPF